MSSRNMCLLPRATSTVIANNRQPMKSSGCKNYQSEKVKYSTPLVRSTPGVVSHGGTYVVFTYVSMWNYCSTQAEHPRHSFYIYAPEVHYLYTRLTYSLIPLYFTSFEKTFKKSIPFEWRQRRILKHFISIILNIFYCTCLRA